MVSGSFSLFYSEVAVKCDHIFVPVCGNINNSDGILLALIWDAILVQVLTLATVYRWLLFPS